MNKSAVLIRNIQDDGFLSKGFNRVLSCGVLLQNSVLNALGLKGNTAMKQIMKMTDPETDCLS